MTIFNLFMNIVTEALRRIFWTLTGNMNLIEDARPIIAMKPEFVYKRIMLTRNKKNYAGIITGELGRIIEPDLDMKGMSIRKTNVPKRLRGAFTEILEEKILKAEKIDIKGILKSYDDLSDSISDSLRNGEVEYSFPRSVAIPETYANPERMEQLRATIIWNALEPDKTIALPEKVNLIKLVDILDKDDPRLDYLKNDYPKKYKAICKTIFNEGVDPTKVKIDISKFGFTSVAIPKDVEKIPEYIIPLIDYETMALNNMSNGFILLESLGITVLSVDNNNYKTNIIKI